MHPHAVFEKDSGRRIPDSGLCAGDPASDPVVALAAVVHVWFSSAVLGVYAGRGGLQAGAAYRFELLWALVLGTICIAFLAEMSGRLAAVSKHTLAAAIRERFGLNFDLVPLLAQLLVDLLVLASEIGGVALSLQLLTGIAFHWWAIPAGFAVWLLLWRGGFCRGFVRRPAPRLGRLPGP